MKRRFIILTGLIILCVASARVYVQWVDPAIGVTLEETSPGEFSVVTVEGNPAAAGLRVGDNIAVINGEPIYNLSELERSLYNNYPGDEVLLTVYRRGYYDDISFVVENKLSRDFLVNALKMLVGLISLGVGLFVVLRKPGDSRAVVFYLLSLCLMLYLYPEAAMTGNGLLGVVDRAISLLFLWIPPLFLHFFLIFPFRKQLVDRHRWVLPVVYFPSFVFFLVFLLIPYEMLWVNNVHAVLRGIYLASGLAALVHGYSQTELPALKKQTGLIVWGAVFGVLPYLVYSISYPFMSGQLQLVGEISFRPLIYASFIFMGAVPLAIAYSILRHRLFDIEVIIRKGLVYTVITGLVVGLYLLLVGYLGSRIKGFMGIDSSYVTIAFTLVVALLFNPLKVRLQSTIDRVFYRERYNYSQVLLEMTEKLNLIVDLDELLVFYLGRVADTMKLEGAAVFIEDREEGGYLIRYARGIPEESDEDSYFEESSAIAGWLEAGVPIDLSGGELERRYRMLSEEERGEMEKLQPALSLPVTIGGRLIGWASLCQKRSGELFSQGDIQLLSTVSRQAAIAVENARTYEDLRLTHERLVMTERLAVLGEMAARIAHEVRNPLASIKMNIQILERKMKLPHPDDEEYLEITKKEIERLNTVMREILDFAKPVRLNPQVSSLNRLLRETVHQIFPESSRDGIVVVEDLEEALPDFPFDSVRVKQAVLNLLLNAVDAVGGSGGVTLKTRLEPGSRDLMAKVEVTDTGKGMSEEVAKKIFEPFYTTKAKGVGLGLANVKRFIEEHGGEVNVRTSEGGPTTFSICLPIVRGG
jgi:signal transduction histidine kinase